MDRYKAQIPLSSVEGTWAAPNTAPMSTVAAPVDTTALAPVGSAPTPADYAAAAQRHYGVTLDPMTVTAGEAPANAQESLKAIRDTNAQAAQAERDRGEQVAQGLEREAALADTQLADLKEQELAQAEHRRIRDEKYQSLFADAQKRSQEAANMSVVDRRTTGQIVTGAVQLALAAIGDGLNRMGGNTQTNGLGMIQSQLDKQLERDLQLQREAIANKRQAAAAKFTEVGIARQMNLDAEGQDELARVFLLRKQGAALKALATNTQAADARALAEQGAADREAKAATLYDAILDRNANTQANTEYKEGLVRRQGAKGGGRPAKAGQMTREQLESIPPEQRTAEQQAALKSFGKNGTDGERGDIIPGYVQDGNVDPVSAGELPELRKKVRATVGVEWLANHLAELWEKAVDPATPAAEKARARSEYIGTKNDLLSGKSVSTGQGTITEGDAKRTGAAVPDLPTNFLGVARDVENYVKGQDPGAASIRALGANARTQLDTELADTYGIRRRQPPRAATAPKEAPSKGVQRATSAADLD